MYEGNFSYSMTKENFNKKYNKMRSELLSKVYDRKLFTANRVIDGNNDYEKYINDVLKMMRKGHTEYVYTWGQLADLIRFEYNKLRVRFHPQEEYVEVWLAK